MLTFVLPAFAAENAPSQAEKRCDELGDTFWRQSVQTNGWGQAAVDFKKHMDERFRAQIMKMKTGNNPKCEITEELFKKADLLDFATRECAEGESDCQKGILVENKEFQCALLEAYLSTNLAMPTAERDRSVIYDLYNQRKNLIAREIETIGITTRISLRSLVEMQVSYVLHRRSECVIERLQTMRNELRNFMEQAVRIPAKFINCGFQK